MAELLGEEASVGRSSPRGPRLSVTADKVEEVEDVEEEAVREQDEEEVEWPGEAEYAARVATGLEAPAELEPLVGEIARLSWRRHQLLEAWVEGALEKLEEVLDALPRMTSSEHFAEQVEEALAGPNLEAVLAEAARLEEALEGALGQYFRDCYGPHPAFDLFGRESPGKLEGSEAGSETRG